ncbi:MAG: RidA family protein [Bacteroidia bacterium]|nr:RidA family protein [Bacteroidia bacterium]MCZ2277677.1 RidA family protein [Bacteroidia bacterium]
MRKIFSTGSEWENRIGYSRAVRTGNIITISGTTALDDGGNPLVDDMEGQTLAIFRKIESVLKQAGSSLHEVVRIRIYVTDISRWEEIAIAFNNVFGNIKPALTLVEVSRLIHPDMLIEIEATAVKA